MLYCLLHPYVEKEWAGVSSTIFGMPPPKTQVILQLGMCSVCCVTMTGHIWSESKWMLVLIWLDKRKKVIISINVTMIARR